VAAHSSANDENAAPTECQSFIQRDRETTSHDNQEIYLTEVDEEDGGVAVGDVKTIYEELEDIHTTLSGHPIIRQWDLSKFMEEWAKEDGWVQTMLKAEKRFGL
jgi:hypothetical protein